jgi:hypothetical protein
MLSKFQESASFFSRWKTTSGLKLGSRKHAAFGPARQDLLMIVFQDGFILSAEKKDDI